VESLEKKEEGTAVPRGDLTEVIHACPELSTQGEELSTADQLKASP